MYPSEEKFANLLDRQGRKWIRPCERFKVNGTTYQPDFYLPDENLHIEVIGTPEAYNYNKGKIEKFTKLYPDVKFIIVDFYNNPYPYGKKIPKQNIKKITIRNKKNISLWVLQKQYDRIKLISYSERRSVSNWIKKIVAEALEKEKI